MSTLLFSWTFLLQQVHINNLAKVLAVFVKRGKPIRDLRQNKFFQLPRLTNSQKYLTREPHHLESRTGNKINTIHNLLISTRTTTTPLRSVFPATTDRDMKFLWYLKFGFAMTDLYASCHQSFAPFFFQNGGGASSFVNIRKINARWVDSYNLIFNLIFHDLVSLFFSNIYFKKEISALNWGLKSSMSLWRLTQIVIFDRNNKIADSANYIFYKIRLLGVINTFVFDSEYHIRTLYYLRRHGFYTMGVVALNKDRRVLDYAIPIGSNSLVAQLFFLRFFINIKKEVQSYRYASRKKLWLQDTTTISINGKGQQVRILKNIPNLKS